MSGNIQQLTIEGKGNKKTCKMIDSTEDDIENEGLLERVDIKKLREDMFEFFGIYPHLYIDEPDVFERIIKFNNQGIEEKVDIELLEIIGDDKEIKKAYEISKLHKQRDYTKKSN